MKGSIQVASYLFKDTAYRWLENPGSWLARWIVAALLGTLLLAIKLGFFYSEQLLQDRVNEFGLHTIVIRNNVSPEERRLPNEALGPQIGGLRELGKLLRFHRIGVSAEIHGIGAADVFVVPTETFLSLAEDWLEEGATLPPMVILSNELPPGMPLTVDFGLFNLTGHSTSVPPRIRQQMQRRPAVLLQSDSYAWMEESGYIEWIVFLGEADKIDDLEVLVKQVATLAGLSGRGSAHIDSPVELLEELESLGQTQRLWATAFGLAAGLIIALVYGAITILEYQQNVFLNALIRSFGVSRWMIFIRYLVENVFIVFLATWAAVLLLRHSWSIVAEMLAVEPRLFDTLSAALRTDFGVNALFPALLIGACIGMLPLVSAIRRPVGSILP